MDGVVRFAERVNKIWDKIFFTGTSFNDIFFVFDNDFMVGNFDNFIAGDGKFGIRKAFYERALNDNLLNAEIIGRSGKIKDVTEFGAFFGLNFKANKAEIQTNDFTNFDNICRGDEFINRIDNHTERGIFADRNGV